LKKLENLKELILIFGINKISIKSINTFVETLSSLNKLEILYLGLESNSIHEKAAHLLSKGLS